MIGKGNLHGHGVKLAAYLRTGKQSETAVLWQVRGFGDMSLKDAFRSVHVMAQATQCEKPFFHLQVRNPASDRALTRDEWERIADRYESKLGYSGQPRAIAFHRDTATGQEHMHVAWSRIDEASLKAKPLPFYKLRLKEVSRELEETFDLTRVRNERAPHEPRAAKRDEAEQCRRLGADGKATRQTIRDCYERSDSGQAFVAALEDTGLMLARGDRRAFVVVDRPGATYALGGRLLGVTVKEVAARLSDLDRAMLPSVEEATALQAARRERVTQRERGSGKEGGREHTATSALDGDAHKGKRRNSRGATKELQELAWWQQENGEQGVRPEPAEHQEDKAMGFMDRLMHTIESAAAAPFGFFAGWHNSPESYYRDPDKPAQEFHIHTDALNINTDRVQINPAPPQEEVKQAEPELSPARQAEEAFHNMAEQRHAAVVQQVPIEQMAARYYTQGDDIDQEQEQEQGLRR